MIIAPLILIAVYAQAVYWLCLRERTEEQTQATWDACLLHGEK